MANYISSLTGSQLDSALTMVDNRVPEGWAVGERDGVPVGEESLYYHNNAKYYAEQAQAQAESAEESAESASQVAQETADAVIAQAFVQESAEVGSIVTIDDGADNIPLKDLKVNLDINQPLHGQANPYPAGGGTQMLNYSLATLGTTTTKFGYGINLTANQAYTFGYYGSENVNIICYLHGTDTRLFASGYTRAYTYTPTEDVTVDISFYNTPSIESAENLFQLEKGLSKTPWQPYSNICPIYPVTEAEVSRTGKNLFDYSALQTGGLDATTGAETTAATARRTGWLKVYQNADYTISGQSGNLRAFLYDANKTFISSALLASGGKVTTTASTAYLRISGGEANYTLTVQLEQAPTATAYEPYEGQRYVVDFGENVVYGGALDVTTGVLTAKYASVDLGSLSWSYTNATFHTGGISSSAKANGASKCSIYKSSSSGADKTIFIGSGAVVYAYDADYTSAASFKTAMAGVQLVYELATPISIQLTPTEVNTLRGDNVIWADCGDITNCEYRADLKLYIDKVVG